MQQQLEALEQQRTALMQVDDSAVALAELDRRQTELLLRYESLLGQIRDTNPRYADLVQPRPLTVAQIQRQVLDQDSLLLQFALGDQRSFLWAVTSDALLSFELPARQLIEDLALDYYRQVSAQVASASPGPGGERGRRVAVKTGASPVGPRLGQLLLAPVRANLVAKRRLIIVGDGALHYVPFGLISIRPEDAKLCACITDESLDLIPYPDGWFGIGADGQGDLPAVVRPLAKMRFQSRRIGDRDVAVAKHGDRETLLGEKVAPEPVPPSWLDRLGRYEITNPDPRFPLTDPQLSLRDGQLYMSYRMPMLSPKVIRLPVRPISDVEAIILGLGRTRGETLRAVEMEGEERIRYSGFFGRKLEPQAAPPANGG